MNLLHVMPLYWPAQGGAERHWQEYAERAAAQGHAARVFTTDALDVERLWTPGRAAVPARAETHNGVAIRRFPLRHFWPTALGYRAIRRALLMASDRNLPYGALWFLARQAPASPSLAHALENDRAPVDLVVGVNIVYEGLLWPAYRRARTAGVPFVFCPLTHLGEPNSPVGRFYTMRHQIELARRAEALLVSTTGEAAFFAGRGVRAERIVRLGAGVTPHEVLGGDGARARARYGLAAGPIILFIGTVSTDKGAMQAIRAVTALAGRGQEPTLVLAGRPLAGFQREYGALPPEVRARCRLLGPVSEADKRDLLDACSVLVLPSRVESFGMVLLEAWLHGKPVIGARAGALPDVIAEGRDGLLVPYGDAAALAEALERVLREPAYARELGAQGERKVYAHYTWDILYARLREVYARLAARRALDDLSWARSQ